MFVDLIVRSDDGKEEKVGRVHITGQFCTDNNCDTPLHVRLTCLDTALKSFIAEAVERLK